MTAARAPRSSIVIVEGSGTALTLAPPAPPSETDGAELAPPAPSKLPLVARNELDGASELAKTNPVAPAIGLPSEADGASVNVEPAPITSDA